MKRKMKLRRRALFGILAILGSLSLFAEDPAATSDFEAALFGGGSAPATAPDSSAAANSSAAADPAAVPANSAPQNGSFDAVAARGEKAKTEYLAGGTVVVESDSTVNPKDETSMTRADANGKLFAKVTVPDYGTLFVAYTAKQYFIEGYSGEGEAPKADDPYKPDIKLAELHYSFDVSKRVFFRLGNQLIAWGPSRIWSPVDFINLAKQDSFATLDSRTGKSGLRIHVPFTHANAFFFADFSGMTADGKYGDPVKTANLAGRIDFTASGFEFGFSGFGGENAQARAGADFSGRLFGTTVYGELAHFGGYDHWNPGIQSSLGFSRTIDELKRWTLSAEGFYNSRGKDLTGFSAAALAARPSDEQVALYQGTWYAYTALEADKLFSPSLATTISALANLDDRSYQLKFSEAFSFPRTVPFTASVSWVGGGRDREFTRYSGTGAIVAAISTRIEF